MKHSIIYIVLLLSFSAVAQEQLSLEACYQLLDTNYPLVKQQPLLEKQNAYHLEILKNNALPQLNLEAQATYQSDVTQIPIASMGIKPLNKDQYKATATINQLIYNGGAINASLQAQTASLKTKQKEVEVSLYQLKKKVNQVYFSILLLQEKTALLKAKQAQLQSKTNEVKSAIEYGTVLPASDKVLEVELIKISQQLSEIDYNKTNLFETLSSLMGQDIQPSVILINPELTPSLQSKINRPELDLFQLKKDQIQLNERLLSKQNLPTITGFATGGYGNPGLNMLNNSFTDFYIVGLKLKWKVFDWNSNKKERQSLAINKDIINNETEVFNLNTNVELKQQELDMEKLQSFVSTDLDIIKLRKDVLKAADSQLKNGVITASAYITELTNLFEDEINLKTHKIQLSLVKANYNITKGNQ